jgi:hypothetical protein
MMAMFLTNKIGKNAMALWPPIIAIVKLEPLECANLFLIAFGVGDASLGALIPDPLPGTATTR